MAVIVGSRITEGCRCMMVLVVLVCLCLLVPSEAVGGAKSRPKPQRRPPKTPKVNPTDATPPAQNIDIHQMTGTWYLLNAASKCPHLIKHGTKVEPTVMTITGPSDQVFSVSTKTRHNHQCWEILQQYHLTSTTGKLTLKGTRPELNTDIVVVETDYTSYAVLYYQKQGKITVKLYSRTVDDLSEPMLTKFEQLAEKHGMGLAYLFPFSIYRYKKSFDLVPA
ncbi:PREDICTED: complement component C8 gamma chain-like [Cyprinodon variegatus]|uniref:complement component C8 gamma chain-like n=1 Tax=Cyprinodon variegatus TaxID=28743 RepID=UPI000742A048|nr:PREDICTED: complement component C8 gamma chain-like [Cyprinodon variegatus]